MSSGKELVSIVMPAYNSEKYLAYALDSVIAQTFESWELIVVDDCSPDNANALVDLYASRDPRIRLVRLAVNSGTAVARNKAIELAQGRYIAFLDSDDCWLPYKLEKQIRFMQENHVSLSYTAYEKIDEGGRGFAAMSIAPKLRYQDLLKTCSIGCLTAIYDAKNLGKVYMPENTRREDFATWLKILKKVQYAYGINEVLAQYRVYSKQSSAKKVMMAEETWRLYRDIEGLGFARSVYCFANYAIRGALRTKLPRLARNLGV